MRKKLQGEAMNDIAGGVRASDRHQHRLLRRQTGITRLHGTISTGAGRLPRRLARAVADERREAAGAAVAASGQGDGDRGRRAAIWSYRQEPPRASPWYSNRRPSGCWTKTTRAAIIVFYPLKALSNDQLMSWRRAAGARRLPRRGHREGGRRHSPSKSREASAGRRASR